MMTNRDKKTAETDNIAEDDATQPRAEQPLPSDDPIERGGPKGPEPTRYGDWESGGRCTDF